MDLSITTTTITTTRITSSITNSKWRQLSRRNSIQISSIFRQDPNAAYYNNYYQQQESSELEEKQDDGGIIERLFFPTAASGIPLPLAIGLFLLDLVVSGMYFRTYLWNMQLIYGNICQCYVR